MRQIVLDTETTGLEPERGHRIIEIGGVELVNRRLTHNNYHQYINPERDIDEGALQVHGLTLEFLADKPRFTEIADAFLAYLGDADLIIHNAPFDVGFLNHELRRARGDAFELAENRTIIDTLLMAREKHPGVRSHNLDVLCKRYEVDNSGRALHGALLDAEILADVYLAMTGGQSDLTLDAHGKRGPENRQFTERLSAERPPLPVIRPNEEEHSAHQEYLRRLRQEAGVCVWLQADRGDAAVN